MGAINQDIVLLYKYDLSNGNLRNAANSSRLFSFASGTSSPASRNATLVSNRVRTDFNAVNRDLGIWHTSICVYNAEYSYSCNGIKIELEPNEPDQTTELGTTNKSQSDVYTYVHSLSQTFGNNSYNVLTNNCNHFSNTLARYLTGEDIPLLLNII